jgi:hypothetical protein
MSDCEKLRERFFYDPLTGDFAWRSPPHNCKKGAVTGRTIGNGSREVRFKDSYRSAHRLAWLYMYGQWPDGNLDHINGNRADNRISNLRIATWSQNGANKGRQTNNKSGFKGVCRTRRGGWQAQIKKDGKVLFLGVHKTPEEAHAAYCKAATKLHGAFARFE